MDDMKMADADAFFLIMNKEILKCKSLLINIDSGKDTHKEDAEEIVNNLDGGASSNDALN